MPRLTARSPRTESAKRLSMRALVRLRAELEPELEDTARRPLYRGECETVPRPCPWIGCRHHMGITEYRRENGSLRIATDDPTTLDPAASCSLDLAELGGMTLQQVGDALGITRERARQIQAAAERKIRGATRAGSNYGS